MSLKSYNDIEEFRDDLLEYLNLEKEYIQEDIDASKNLSLEQKIEEGLVIEKCKVVSGENGVYLLDVSENNTKLRTGDKATLSNAGRNIDIQMVENGSGQIKIATDSILDSGSSYQLAVDQCVMLDPLIALAERIEDGMAGASWYKALLGLETPRSVGTTPLPASVISSAQGYLEGKPLEAYDKACHRPSVWCIQGPPGTGKTDVLSRIASAYSKGGKEVLILCNTHTAVNNALNKIASMVGGASVIKIGDELKGEDLDGRVVRCSSYDGYLNMRKNRKKARKNVRFPDILGMTMQSAIINLGLRNSNFSPGIILVDEAGQIPFAHGALIGSFKSNCVVFIGDDRQMPPIFHEKLCAHPFSQSIFTYVSEMYPWAKTVLTRTYRMNAEITDMVSKHFYEPYGIVLESSDKSASRTLTIPSFHADGRISHILSSPDSIHKIDVSTKDIWEDSNEEEAEFVAELAKEAMDRGLMCGQFAIVTPYRRQVKAIREAVIRASGIADSSKLPLIDTVERLQGQDVDMIILSTSVTSPSYYASQRDFLLNPNRLNVMLSRAKMKVVVVSGVKWLIA